MKNGESCGTEKSMQNIFLKSHKHRVGLINDIAKLGKFSKELKIGLLKQLPIPGEKKAKQENLRK